MSPLEVHITGEGVTEAIPLFVPLLMPLPMPLIILLPMPLPLPEGNEAGNVREARTSFTAGDACGNSSTTEHSSASESVARLYTRRSPLDRSSSKYCVRAQKKEAEKKGNGFDIEK